MEILEQINRNTDTLIGAEGLEKKLGAGKRLRVKLGVDPTRPDLTFGHMVVLNKLRQFQELGHDCCLLIGDYTATIGDPTGRSETRPILTPEAVKENSATYLEQAFRILDAAKTEVRYNSEWFSKMDFTDCLNLARKMTVARMLERDDFAKRYSSHTPISIVEFLYPLIQGYDSIMLSADVELGGSDQLFNMLVGRTLQKEQGLSEQAVITMPLLVGLDGSLKMSKSAGNYIAFNDSPKEMFGKIMSIPDDVMWAYYQYLLECEEAEIEACKTRHPMDVKKELAVALVTKFYENEQAQYERQQFEQVFAQHQLPDEMPELVWAKHIDGGNSASVVDLLHASGMFASKKEIRRLIGQSAVKVDGEKISDESCKIERPSGDGIVIQAGKRKFLRVTE